MKERYGRRYAIGSKALKKGLVTVPSDMFDLMQEIATIHSDTLGYTMEYFYEEQKGWALINQYAKIYRLPRWRETVTVETWPTSTAKLVSNRCYRILDEDGNIILEALSKWVFMDKVKKRPIKPPSEILQAYGSDIPVLFDGETPAMPKTEETREISGSDYIVKRSYIDTNFHVNNVRYVIWAEDDIPDKIFYEKSIKTVNVNFKKEGIIGTHVKTCCYETAKDEYVNIMKDDAGNVLAEVLLAF